MSLGTDTGTAPALAQLTAVLEAGGPELVDLLGRTEARLGEVAAASGDALGAHAGATLAAGGKRLRPVLVFLSAGSAAGVEPLAPGAQAAAVHAATAVELLHMATLVHDDVLDRASLRRGRPTVFSTGGRQAATATGDLLFSRAFAELVQTASIEAVRALSAASSALARGELMQRDDAWSADVSPARYLERCELKTARLFEAACRIGALLGRPGAGAADRLGAFGAHIGIAFQIFDDVLDVAGPTERTGKRRGTDLLDGTVTLPLIIARGRDARLAARDLRTLAGDPAAAEAVCDEIAATGALADARAEALRHVRAGKRALEAVELSAASRRALELVADGVVERYA